MMSAKLLAFLALQVINVSGLGKNVLFNLPELKKEQLNWPQQKNQTIEYLINTLLDVGNITLIGWQQVWHSNGSLREIRAIELTIFSQIPSEVVLSSESINLDDELPTVRETIKKLSSSTGIQLSGGIVQSDRYGFPIKSLRVNANETYIREDGRLPFWHGNMPTSNATAIRSKAKVLGRESVLPVSVLQWTNGKFDVSSSVIVPELLAGVTSSTSANLTVVEAAMMGTVRAMLIDPDYAPEYVAHYMEKEVPGFNWIVGENWLGTYTTYDTFVQIAYRPVPNEFSADMYIVGVQI